MTQVNLENRTWARSAMRLSVELPIGALKAYRVIRDTFFVVSWGAKSGALIIS